MKRSLSALLTAAWAVAVANMGCCWGPEVHEIIARHSIELLPAQMKPFYQENARYIVPMSNLPDDWRQTHKSEIGNQHYIDLDLLGKPPFDGLVMPRAGAEKKFGKQKIAEAGTLPWAIEERFNRLVKAFRARDAVGIVVQSAVIMHYVGDAHVPFHVTKDYDGRRPEQKGVHGRWEGILPVQMLKPESIKPRAAEAVSDPLKSAFKWCIASFGKLDAIYAAEDTARAADPTYGWSYYRSLYKDTGSILKSQIEAASQASAGMITAAWKKAGRPDIPPAAAPLLWGM